MCHGMSIKLEHTHVDTWLAVVMENDAMRVVVVPEIGGKITSLVSRRTGREWLWKNPHLPLIKPPPDATDFGAFDAGGWDEVIPTVNRCRVPNSAWGERTLTDHGELWTDEGARVILIVPPEEHLPASMLA